MIINLVLHEKKITKNGWYQYFLKTVRDGYNYPLFKLILKEEIEIEENIEYSFTFRYVKIDNNTLVAFKIDNMIKIKEVTKGGEQDA